MYYREGVIRKELINNELDPKRKRTNNQFDHLSYLVAHSEPMSNHFMKDLERFTDFEI